MNAPPPDDRLFLIAVSLAIALVVVLILRSI